MIIELRLDGSTYLVFLRDKEILTQKSIKNQG